MSEDHTQSAFMYFLPKGKVKGETNDVEMKPYQAFDVIDWSMKGTNPTNIGKATEGGKVTLEPISITKMSDSASVQLFKEMCASTTFKSAVLVVRRDLKPFLIFTFSNAVISMLELGQGGPAEEPKDKFDLDYGAVKVEYLAMDASGETRKVTESYWSRVLAEATDSVG